MSPFLGKGLLFGGLVALILTGYQAMTYRESVRLLQQEFEGLPVTLLLQLLVAAVASVLGGLQVSGSLRPVRIADAPKPVVMRPQRLDFATVGSRGRALASLPHLAAIPPVPPIS